MSANDQVLADGMGVRDGQLTTSPQPNAAEGGLNSLSFVAVMNAIVRGKWLILGAAIVGVLLGLLVTHLTTPVYEATARIEINPESQQAVELEGQAAASPVIDPIYILTQEELLQTRVLRERASRALRLDQNAEIVAPQATDAQKSFQAIKWLEENVDAGNIPNTRLFQIVVESSDPNLSAQIANQYATEFIDLNIARQLASNDYARNFLVNQLAETKKNLEESERNLINYARERGIMTVRSSDDSGEVSITAQNLAAANEALRDARTRRIASEERLRNRAKPERRQNSASSSLEAELARLKAAYREKRDLFKPEYPEMAALQARIDSLESSLATISNRDQSEIRDELLSQFRAARGEERQLASQLAKLEEVALSERANSVQYNILKRDVDTNAAQYDALLERMKQIGPAGTQVKNLISLVDPAEAPRAPVRPVMLVNLALGLAVGLIVGALAVVLSVVLSSRIRGQDDVNQLIGRPFIGAVPFHEDFHNSTIEMIDPKSPVYEALVSIANRLRFVSEKGFPKTLSLSSSIPNEGKSSTAYGLAQVLARQGRRVLLVDADLRMPTILGLDKSELLTNLPDQIKAKGRVGITDILLGDISTDEAIFSVAENFDLLISGQTPPNPAELLVGESFAAILRSQEARYDHVIVDAPPVLGLADSPVIASLVAGTLFVVQANRATSRQARKAIERLEANRGNVLGVVLSKTEPADGNGDYGYNYDYVYDAESAEPSLVQRLYKRIFR